LNVHGIGGGSQMEIHTVAPLIPEPCPTEVEIVIAQLKSMIRPMLIKF
jgi:hypothetical protein